MGLFDKFKKKAPEEEQVVETTVEKSEVAEESEQEENVQPIEEEAVSKKTSETVQDDVDDADRYFTIMVENAYQLEDDNGVVIVGNLHGKIKKGDKIYVLFPNNRMITSTAEEIEIGPGRRVTEAENDKVALQIFEVKKKELMQKLIINYLILISMKIIHYHLVVEDIFMIIKNVNMILLTLLVDYIIN